MSYFPISYKQYKFPDFTQDQISKNAHSTTKCPVHNTIVYSSSTEEHSLGRHNIRIFKYGRCSSPNCGYVYNYYEYLTQKKIYIYIGTEIVATGLAIKNFEHFMMTTQVDAQLKTILEQIHHEKSALLNNLFQITSPTIERRNKSKGFKIKFVSNPKNVYDFVLELNKIREKGFIIGEILFNLQESKVKFDLP